MLNGKRRKRPCSICRKWFLPDIRHHGRQRTCNKNCSKELHRRQCSKWNMQNVAYFKEIYLSQKLNKITQSSLQDSSPIIKRSTSPPKSRINLNLPVNIFCTEMGMKNFILIEYFFVQVINRLCINFRGFT
ncbi:MAG: hypothetical protein GY870_10260 [archaeon]|nr:hypothetical protein [archaeon]